MKNQQTIHVLFSKYAHTCTLLCSRNTSALNNLPSLSHTLMMQLVYLMKVKKYFSSTITSRCILFIQIQNGKSDKVFGKK